MVRREQHQHFKTRWLRVGAGSLTGLLTTAMLLSPSACTRRDFSMGVKDASVDRERVNPANPDTRLASDVSSADPFTGGSAAKTLANLDLTRAVASTVMAGDNAIALFADFGLAMIDLSDPTAPVQGPALSTDGKVISVEYDEELGVAYAADITGKLYALRARSSEGFGKLFEIVVPGSAQKVLGLARLGSTLHVLTGDSVVPVAFTFSGETLTGAKVGTAFALPNTASHITAGGGALYLASKSAVQAWSVPATGAASMLGQYAISGEPRALLAKGSKVLVGMAGVGLATVDFGNPAAPVSLALNSFLSDLTAARLFGRTLAVGLQRNLTATIDLADFAAPRVLTVDQGTIPQFMAVLNGILLRGSATSAQVVNIPPTVSISIPSVTMNSFPLHGQIPVTFSKPIDPTSATSKTLSLSCAGVAVAGQVLVALERTSLSFIPEALLPAGVKCTLDLSAIKDASGAGVVQGNSLTVTTAAETSKPVTNSGSKFAHVPDGTFTDFDPATGSNAGEWSDVTPAKGMYTYFYGDFKDGKLNILNDWFFNSEKIEPDCYNEFYVWTGGGSEQWTIRAYADRKVTVLKNGVVMDVSTGDVAGSAGYGPSPNEKTPHTIYELQIAAQPGTWGVRLHDPGPTYSCKRLATEPSHIQGTLGTAGAGNGVTIDSTQKPVAPVAATLLSPSDQASVGITPTLAWSAGASEGLSMLHYHVQIAKVPTFKSLVWSAGTMSTSITLPAGLLGAGVTYYWRVVAGNVAGQAVSGTFSFTTRKGDQPDAGFDAPAKEAGVDAPKDSGEVGGARGLVVQFINSADGDVAGPGQGTVTTEPAGIRCSNGGGTCSAYFNLGSKITMTATPAKGWHFTAWGGECAASLKTASGTFVMPDGAEAMLCTVRFDADGSDGGTAGTGGSSAGNTGTGTGGADAAAGTGGAGTSGTAGVIVDAAAPDSSSGDAGLPVLTGNPSALAGDSSFVYIGQTAGGGIYRYPIYNYTNAVPTLVVPGVSVPANGLAVGPDYVYWIDGDKIMRASKTGVDAGVGGEAFVTGETGLFILGSNHMADYAKTNPTHLFWVSGSLSSATIKTRPIDGPETVTIASEVGMTADDRVVADSGLIFWVGTWHGSGRVIYRSELASAGPIQVGTDTGVTGLARFASGTLAYMLCTSSECVLKLTGVTGTVQGTLAGLPANLTKVAGYARTVFAYNAGTVYQTPVNLTGSSLYVSDELAADVYPSNGAFFYITSAGELQKLAMP